MSDIEVRVLTDDADRLAAANLFRTAMVGFPQLSEVESDRLPDLLEPGRTLGAFVDGHLAGTTDATTGTVTLPGGARVGHLAVTHVGVDPAWTRRGIATALLTHQLQEAAREGQVVASLRASQATIYERFGYGVGGISHTVEVDTRARLRPSVVRDHRVRLVDPQTARDLLPRIYETHRTDRPGSVDRTDRWWLSRTLRSAQAPTYVAVFGPPGAESGFARYRAVSDERWFVSGARTVIVDDLFAPTAEAHADLVGFLLDLDPVDRVVFALLPTDDPLPWLLTDRRAARVTEVRDEAWVRVIDLPGAFARRSLTVGEEVTVRVIDPVLHHNDGTWRFQAGSVDRTDAPAGLQIEAHGLGSVLLGAVSWSTLAAAGTVRVFDPDALSAAERLFGAPGAPFSGIYF